MNHRLVLASRRAVLLLAFLSIAAVSRAAGPRWRQATPFGGSMQALAQAPSAPQTVYAATDSNQLFASGDGGATWSRRTRLPLGVGIVEMFVDSQEPRTVYARTGASGLLRTRDGGLGWTPLGAGLAAVLEIAPDRESPHALYAATASGLYRSPDGGDTWSLAAFDGLRVLSFAIDPGDSSRSLAATGDPAFPVIWKSADHGESWAQAPPPLIDLELNGFYALRFAFDPARADTIYLFFPPNAAYFFTGLPPAYRSTDGGTSWELLPEAFGARDLWASANGVLFAATDSGISRSSDQGETWSPPFSTPTDQDRPNDAMLRVAEDLSTPGDLFAIGSAGVWRSGDGGANWQASNQGLNALPVSSLAAVPTGPETVLAVAGSSLFRSADQGESWTRVHSQSSGMHPETVEVIDPRDPLTMYGIFPRDLDDIVVRSTNGGVDWAEFPNPYVCGGGSLCSVGLSVLALDPENPDSVFVAGSYFFHFGGMGSFLESGAGQTWTNLHAVHNLRTLAFEPGRKGAMFGINCGGLFKSANRGASWRKAGGGLQSPLCGSLVIRPELAIDPFDPRRIYLGSEAGVFASSDGGETFRAMNKGLPGAAIRTLLIDPSDPAKLYAAVPGRGVFRWKAGLRTWAPLNAGLPTASFNGVLALDPQAPSILYAGTADQGIFRLDLGEQARQLISPAPAPPPRRATD